MRAMGDVLKGPKMGGFETAIELVLVVLLSATLIYAIRLHRAIGTLRQDRGSLEHAAAEFDSGARHAEAGLERLREAAQTLGGQLNQAVSLKDDLAFLSERGEQLADRLDTLVRAGRAAEAAPARSPPGPVAMRATPEVRSQAERDLLLALRGQL